MSGGICLATWRFRNHRFKRVLDVVDGLTDDELSA